MRVTAKYLKVLFDIKLPSGGEDEAYCIGYWMRIGNMPRPPRSADRQEGWDAADAEIAAGTVSAAT